MAAPAHSAFLSLLDMQSHSEEKLAKNGIVKDIHVVVKGSPFHVLLGGGGSGGRSINFAKLAFDASLVYDCEGNKTVDFVKAAPLESKYSPSGSGDKVEFEFRIKVLTSQHEDMLFRIRVQALDPVTHALIPGLALMTPSIKVISKPEQIKKKPTQPPANKKRAISAVVADPMMDSLGRLEARQEETNRILERILVEKSRATLVKPEVVAPLAPLAEFEQSFARMARAFLTVPPEERASAIRRLASASGSDASALTEMIDMFSVEGLRREPTSMMPNSPPLNGECRCVDCPHRQELSRVDGFYQRFLENGLSGLSAPAEITDFTLDACEPDASFASFLSFA
eukprot:TRINITY_DN4578_c1_g1_i1.p2 TRINITY_DN4578_c1_g1~~TRINITY_DN4578_c1_g1_i1.p2  ORF type:complete len:341 (+),score=84.93 TRINITY_DN4578_c1_g1_i1:94-1116(+)